MLMLLLLSILLRKERLAIALFWLIIVAFQGLASDNLTTGLIDAALGSAIFLFVLVRFGLLASIFAEFFVLLGILYPLTSDFSAWYSGVTTFRARHRAGPGHLWFLYFSRGPTSLPRRSTARLS